VQNLLRLITLENISLQLPALQIVGNLAFYSDELLFEFFTLDVLDCLLELLVGPGSEDRLRQQAAWVLSNVASCNSLPIIEKLMRSQYMTPLATQILEGSSQLSKECLMVVLNFSWNANAQQVFKIVHQYGLYSLVETALFKNREDCELQLRVLDNCYQIFAKLDSDELVLFHAQKFEHSGLFRLFESYHLSKNVQVSARSQDFIERLELLKEC